MIKMKTKTQWTQEMLTLKIPREKNQLIELRKLLVPRSVTLLHSLLHTTGQFAKSVALADLVSSDQYNIYTAFSKQDIKELLSKIRESSLVVMDQGKDPWGYSKQ